MSEPLHTIGVFVANKPGVLLRVTIIFARRGFNIESLVVSSALDGRFSRMTITAKGDAQTLEQIVKHLNKLVDVVHATDTISSDAVTHELGLVKVLVKPAKRAEFLQILDHFEAKTLDVTDDVMVIQLSGSSTEVDSFVDMISKFKVLELVRSGKMVMLKGETST